MGNGKWEETGQMAEEVLIRQGIQYTLQYTSQSKPISSDITLI